jgi:hypothetical protein
MRSMRLSIPEHCRYCDTQFALQRDLKSLQTTSSVIGVVWFVGLAAMTIALLTDPLGVRAGAAFGFAVLAAIAIARFGEPRMRARAAESFQLIMKPGTTTTYVRPEPLFPANVEVEKVEEEAPSWFEPPTETAEPVVELRRAEPKRIVKDQQWLQGEVARDAFRTPEELMSELRKYASSSEIQAVELGIKLGSFPESYLGDLVAVRRAQFVLKKAA